MPAHPLKTKFMECRPALLRFLQVRGLAPDEADDLLQDLFVKLESGSFGPVSEPRAYLYRMADNLLLDRRRSASRRAAREDRWSGAGSPDGDALVDPSVPADEALIARQRLQRVALALRALPDRTIEIFRRFRIDGERQKAIAEDMGISVSAVEKHLQRVYELLLGIDADAGRDEENGPARRLSLGSESDAS